MKQKLFIVILVCTSFLAIGCTNQQSQQDVKNENQPQRTMPTKEKKESKNSTEKPKTDSEQPTVEEESPPVTQKEKGDQYLLKTASYQNGNLSIQYPQLVQMQNKDKEQLINQRIKDEVMTFVKQYQDVDITVNMNYQIELKTDEMLSIVYTGETSVSGGMYPTHMLFTTNFNIKDGRKVKVTDLFVTNVSFVHSLKQSPYSDWENPVSPNKAKEAAVLEHLNTIQIQNLIDGFKHADNPNLPTNQYGIFTYFLKDSLVVSIQVPHALGDHAEFKIKLNQLTQVKNPT